jgi:hypothetical protein
LHTRPHDAALEKFERLVSAYPNPEVLFEPVRDSFRENVLTRSFDVWRLL